MAPTTQLSPRAALVWGLLSSGMGLYVILLAAGVIPVDESRFKAPHWVVGLAGSFFVLAGPLVILSALRTVAGTRSAKLVQFVLGGLLVTSFALVADWIAFGPGERRFSGGLTLLAARVSTRPGELEGRVVFGIAAVLLDLFAVWGWVRGFRDLRRGWRRPPGADPTPM